MVGFRNFAKAPKTNFLFKNIWFQISPDIRSSDLRIFLIFLSPFRQMEGVVPEFGQRKFPPQNTSLFAIHSTTRLYKKLMKALLYETHTNKMTMDVGALTNYEVCL
jgi:hypothetical protein